MTACGVKKYYGGWARKFIEKLKVIKTKSLVRNVSFCNSRQERILGGTHTWAPPKAHGRGKNLGSKGGMQTMAPGGGGGRDRSTPLRGGGVMVCDKFV